MLLHFVHDEKVTDDLIENCSSVDPSDIFLVFGNTSSTYKHITSTSDRVLRFDPATQDINTIISSKKPSGILLHSFSYPFALAVLQITSPLPIAWCGQGRDVYNLPRIEPYMFAPLTASWLNAKDRFRALKYRITHTALLRKAYYRFIVGQPDRYGIEMAARKKIDIYTSNIEADFALYSRYYPNSLRFVYSTFSSIDQFVDADTTMRLEPDANGILIGNSNTPESNHFDAFELLQQVHTDQPIIAPLNYGHGTSQYREAVIKQGRKLFGSTFLPVTEFMPKSEYITLQRSCSVGIFFHYRQQAFGNIVTMLFFGSRVYMSSRSTLYTYFRSIGVHVYSLEHDLAMHGLTALDPKLADENRAILTKHYSHEQVLQDLRNLHATIIA